MKIALWQAKSERQTPTNTPSQKQTSPKTPSREVMNFHTSNWWWCVTARVGRRGLLRDRRRAARDWESENCIVKKSAVSVIDSLLHTHTNDCGSTRAHPYVSPDAPFPISWRWEIQSSQRNAIYSASSSHTYTRIHTQAPSAPKSNTVSVYSCVLSTDHNDLIFTALIQCCTSFSNVQGHFNLNVSFTHSHTMFLFVLYLVILIVKHTHIRAIYIYHHS